MVIHALQRLRERGPGNALRHLVHWFSELYYEARFGISTREPARLTELGYANEEYVDYAAPAYRTLCRAFAHLQVVPGRSVFLDYGCGRGRALTVAATHPFRKVVGVELVPELLESARIHLARARPRLRCHESELILGNAVDYVPPSDVDHIYLFNPFRGPTLRRVVDNIRDSWLAAPRPLTVIYLNPDEFATHAKRLDWLQPVHAFRSYPDTDVVVYRTQPPYRPWR